VHRDSLATGNGFLESIGRGFEAGQPERIVQLIE
jgi:hypothetical protein